jgi:signal peptidase
MSIQTPSRSTVRQGSDPASRIAAGDREGDGSARERVGLSAIALAGVLGIVLLAFVAVTLYGYSVVRLATGSMSPAYPTDSVLLVRDVPGSQVHVGDVVTVTRDGTVPITHRVVETRPDTGDGAVLILKGDANTAVDPEPYRVERVGLVMGGVPFGGRLLVTLQSPIGLGIATVVVAALVLWAWWPRRERGLHVRE